MMSRQSECPGTTIAGALAVVDEDGSGSLDFEEFVQLLLIYRALTQRLRDRHGLERLV